MIIMTPALKKLMDELKLTNAETFYHALHVKNLTVKMIKKMNYLSITNYTPFETDCICKGALLHDVGKLEIENVILTKDVALSDSDWINIKKHPAQGYAMIEDELTEDEREIIKNICLYHHERLDGKGYVGLTDIPLYVQLVSVCDVFDALCSDRVYKTGMPYDRAIDLMENGKAGYFDHGIIDCLKIVVSEFSE